jgi:hypothetical protein
MANTLKNYAQFTYGTEAERVIVEHLWSRAVANNGNQWQIVSARKRLKQAETVATGCR